MSVIRKVYNITNSIIRRGYWFNNVKYKDCRKLWSFSQFNTEVVNLGSTSGLHAFDYSEIENKCANWAISTNPLLGDFAILKNYISFLKDGATVIIPICPFSSLAGSYRISDDRYYSILYPSSIPDFSYRRSRIIKNEMLAPVFSYPFYGFCLDIKHLLCLRKMKQLSEEEMKSDSKRWMDDWKKEFGITDFGKELSLVNKDAIEDAVVILNDIVSFCKERGFRPAILVPPIYHTLNEGFDDALRKKVIQPLFDRIEDKTVWSHNYMDDQAFVNDRSLFMDSFLLNTKGARLFTRRVLKDLAIIM